MTDDLRLRAAAIQGGMTTGEVDDALAQRLTRPPYTYAATVVRVLDGDTYVLDLDLGFDAHLHAMVRLLGWNCPEKNTEAGRLAAALAEKILRTAQVILVSTEKDAQTFARWLAHVRVDGQDLGAVLAHAGLAAPLVR